MFYTEWDSVCLLFRVTKTHHVSKNVQSCCYQTSVIFEHIDNWKELMSATWETSMLRAKISMQWLDSETLLVKKPQTSMVVSLYNEPQRKTLFVQFLWFLRASKATVLNLGIKLAVLV